MVVLNPPFRSLENATIEKLIIPEEKLQELKNVLANPKLPEVHKSFMMSRITGHCAVCGGLPSQIATYKMKGITKIEKYCDNCILRIRT